MNDKDIQKKFTMRSEGYKFVKKLEGGEYILENPHRGLEIWLKNKNHASFGLKYKNTHLEFARSL